MTKNEIMNLFVAQSVGRTPIVSDELSDFQRTNPDIRVGDILVVYHLNDKKTKETVLMVDTLRTIETKLDMLEFNEFLSEKPNWLVFESK